MMQGYVLPYVLVDSITIKTASQLLQTAVQRWKDTEIVGLSIMGIMSQKSREPVFGSLERELSKYEQTLNRGGGE